MRTIVLFGLLFVCSATSARDINKCKVDGVTVYQELPCKPGSTTGKLSINDSAASEKDTNKQLNKLDSELASSKNSIRLREIGYEIRKLEVDIQSYRDSMNSEIATLKNSKSRASNNVAGATWEESISTEMNAISAKYQTEIKIAQDTMASLRQERTSIKEDNKQGKLSINDSAASEEDTNKQLNKLDSELASSKISIRLREIGYEIRKLEVDIQSYRDSMNSEIATLKNSKSRASNNVAGATWEESISTEMNAISAKYQTEIKIAQDTMASLRQERTSLKQDSKQ